MINNDIIEKDIYSTEEIKTNKVWIDGKPIYRKVFVKNNLKIENTARIPMPIPDIKLIIGFNCFLVQNSSLINMHPFTEYTGSNIYSKTTGFDYNIPTQELFVKGSAIWNASVDRDIYFIFEYTKTTD